MSIGSNLEQIRSRIRGACARAGRDPATVDLVCVSKTVDADAIRAAFHAGARVFGESYGQHLRDKATALADLDGLVWHFIGPVQRNKVRHVAGRAALIHSVHSADLLRAIDARAGKMGLVQQQPRGRGDQVGDDRRWAGPPARHGGGVHALPVRRTDDHAAILRRPRTRASVLRRAARHRRALREDATAKC